MDSRPARHRRFRRLARSVAWYRKRLRQGDKHEHRLAYHRLVQLAGQNYPRFARICCLLLDAPERKARYEALYFLYRHGRGDDAEAEARALAALNDPDLHIRARAFLALGTVGTAACVPALRALAEAGERRALPALARQARTDEDRAYALALARERLLSPIHDVRHEALEALHWLSTAEAEEELLIEAYERYPCVYIALALGGASGWVMPYLYRKQAEIGPGWAEYEELQSAINRLLSRLRTGHDPAVREDFP
jgi:hypothetical protein